MPAIPVDTLTGEAACYTCLGISLAQSLELALLNRIVSGGGGGGTPGGADTQVQFNDAGAFGGDADFTWNKTTNLLAIVGGQTITAEANEVPFTISGYSLTGANVQSLLSLAGTWNTSGNPTAISLSITNTASGAASNIFEFLAGAAGATSIFNISKVGTIGWGTTAFDPLLRKSTVDGGCVETSIAGFSSQTHTVFGYTGGAGGLSGFTTINVGNFAWSNSGTNCTTRDTAISRTSAGLLQINNGTAGTLRDLSVRNIFTNNAAAALSTNTALTDFAAAAGGTLLNAPTAGNPTKWIAIVDNGTTRYIPTWT